MAWIACQSLNDVIYLALVSWVCSQLSMVLNGLRAVDHKHTPLLIYIYQCVPSLCYIQHPIQRFSDGNLMSAHLLHLISNIRVYRYKRIFGSIRMASLDYVYVQIYKHIDWYLKGPRAVHQIDKTRRSVQWHCNEFVLCSNILLRTQ